MKTKILTSSLLFSMVFTSCKKDASTSSSATVKPELQVKKTNSTLSKAQQICVTTPQPFAPKRWFFVTEPTLTWQDKIRLLRDHDYSDLSEKELDYLFRYSQEKPEGVKEGTWFVISNEIFEQLRVSGAAKDRYSNELVSIVRNAEANFVIRDYAIQHLGHWISAQRNSGTDKEESFEELKDHAIASMLEVLSEGKLEDTTVPGTTLHTLSGLYIDDIDSSDFKKVEPEIDRYLSGKLEYLLEVPSFNKLSANERANVISVINTVGNLRRESLVEPVRSIATNPNQSPTLRLSAIAALGGLGYAEDETFLKSLVNSKTQANARYRFAAQSALKKLSQF